MIDRADPPWRTASGCVIVRVRVTPKSSKDTIDGVETTAGGAALRVRVRALPTDGEANAAVELLLADWIGVPKSSVSVASGHRARVKSLKVSGTPADLDARLATRLDAL